MSAPEPDEEECWPNLNDEQCHAFQYWSSDEAGFGVLEAFDLVLLGVSPSEHREFVRKHRCSPRQALRILLP